MATSGTITTTDTVRDIAKDALIELEVIGANEEPSAGDMELCVRRLNWMLKDWQNDGLNLWRLEDGEIEVEAGTSEVTLTPRMADVSDVRLVQSGGSERTLYRTEWGEFAGYPNKTTTGSPSIYVPRPGRDTTVILLWPVPSEDVTLRYSGARVIEDVTDAAETIDVPQQYTRAVMMNLAANVSSAFGKAGSPAGMRADAEAARLYSIMRANDRPASYFIGSNLYG